MLSIRLICVGKLGERFWHDAVQEYEKRLSGFCKLEIIELPEQRLLAHPTQGQLDAALHREAALIRAKIGQGEMIIALCIEGKTMSSEQLADRMGQMMLSGTSRIAFLVGGSCGLDAALKQEAHMRLSMSPMTFPHHLARVMVLEQVYRALNIQAGGKYHK